MWCKPQQRNPWILKSLNHYKNQSFLFAAAHQTSSFELVSEKAADTSEMLLPAVSGICGRSSFSALIAELCFWVCCCCSASLMYLLPRDSEPLKWTHLGWAAAVRAANVSSSLCVYTFVFMAEPKCSQPPRGGRGLTCSLLTQLVQTWPLTDCFTALWCWHMDEYEIRPVIVKESGKVAPQ